jgi:hypothetical protein
VKVKKTALAVLLAAITAFAATELMAQVRGGGFPGGGMRAGSRGGQGDGNRDQRPGGDQRPAVQADPVGQAEYLLEMLREDLKLSPEQQAAWNPYADKVSALAADLSRERGRIKATMQLKALQRIDQSVDTARNRLTALEEIASAAKALYERLTPEQKAIADMRLAATLATNFNFGIINAPELRDIPRPAQ